MSDIKKDDVTPEHIYLNRRTFLKTSIYAGTGLATVGAYRIFRSAPEGTGEEAPAIAPVAPPVNSPTATATTPKLTSFQDITNYNNYYEFSTDKEGVASAAKSWSFQDWGLEVGGLVKNPFKLNLKEISAIPTEERIYRFRCVEGWSMVIPWLGFPLSRLLERAGPLANATYVAFETYYNPSEMQSSRSAGIQFPYVEGLRLDEAQHPLTLLTTGLYGKKLLNQNGAPIRLVVPWKYGFKSIKSVVKITLLDHEPPTTWNIANPSEYGFYSNVNPEVDHPRWSQKKERRIGEFGMRETLPFNGYGEQVAQLYRGMDLRKYF